MSITNFLSRFFGREDDSSQTKNIAKDRLRLVLVHDRLDISEAMMEQLRIDLIATIGKYMDIDQESLDVNFSRDDGGVALVANIPVRNVKRPSQPEPAPAKEAAI